MKGVPVRIEMGPRDIENGECVLVSRDDRRKQTVKLENIVEAVEAELKAVHDRLYQKALENREKHTYRCISIDEIKQALEQNGDGFVYSMWCGDEECEDKVKELTGIGSRCIPFEQEQLDTKCVCCGKPAKHMVCWGNAY